MGRLFYCKLPAAGQRRLHRVDRHLAPRRQHGLQTHLSHTMKEAVSEADKRRLTREANEAMAKIAETGVENLMDVDAYRGTPGNGGFRGYYDYLNAAQADHARAQILYL